MALIAWYKLDGNANDSIGDNHGSASSASFVSGKINDCASIDSFGSGTRSSSIDLGINGFGVTGKIFSISCWVKYSSGSIGGLVSTNHGATFHGFDRLSGGGIRFGLRNSSTHSVSSSSLADDDWHHLVGVCDGEKLILYVDGTLINTNNLSNLGSTISTDIFTINNNGRLSGSTGDATSYNGLIDDVRFYDNALSLKEVKELYKCKVAHYKLNDPDSINDETGFHNPTVTNNGASFSTNSKIFNGSYSFNGSSNHISTLNNGISEDMTVSAWVYPTVAPDGIGRVIVTTYHWNGGGSNQHGWTLGNNFGSTDNIAFQIYRPDGSTFSTTNSGFFANHLNTWVHVAGVFRASGSIELYLNGVLTNSSSGSATTIRVSTMSTRIGARADNGSQGNWAGNINDVRIYATALSANDVLQIYKERGSIDDTGNLLIKDLIETKHKPLILDYTVWQNGQTGGVGNFSQNGSTSENNRILGLDPFGKETVLWEATPDATSGADGGWNHNIAAADTDNTKMYRFSVWVNRTVTGNGSFYLGCNGYGSVAGVFNRSDGTTNNTNPYFWVGTPSQGVWTLVVGHVWPEGSGGGSQHPDSGRYTLAGGKVGGITHDFVWRSETTSARHRSYLYYTTDTNTRQRWAYPRVDVIDGTEPTIDELLSGFDSNYIEYVRSKGGTKNISLDVNSKSTYLGNISEVSVVEGLIGWWPLNGDVLDISGEGNNGTNNGAVVTSGLNQLAYDFNGDTSYIELSSPLTIFNTPFTVSMWCYFDDDSRGILLGDFERSSAVNINFEKHTSRRLRLYWKASPDIFTGNDVVNLNEWQHIVFVRDKSNTEVRIYVQGNLVYTHSGALSDETTSSLHLLGRDNRTGTTAFDGRMQDVRIYNRALSVEEVKILFEITRGSSTTKVKKTKDSVFIKGEFDETI
jgi:hypothetical protein